MGKRSRAARPPVYVAGIRGTVRRLSLNRLQRYVDVCVNVPLPVEGRRVMVAICSHGRLVSRDRTAAAKPPKGQPWTRRAHLPTPTPVGIPQSAARVGS